MLNVFCNASDTNSDDDYLTVSSSASSSSEDSFVSLPSLADTLSSQFSNVPNNFNIVHINAQSIPAHFPDMLASFEHQKHVHAILISESWLKPCLPDISFSSTGFHLIRNDRTWARGGGVAIYLRTYIPFSIVNTSPQPTLSNAGEHLFVEVILSHVKILLGVYYSPSSQVNYFPSFENLLDNFTPSYSHTILMGDFNTCLLKKDSRSLKLESIIHSDNLYILPLSATHLSPNHAPSLLDLIIVSSPSHVSKHGQCTSPFSYHDSIFLSYKIRPPKAKPRIIQQRNFGKLNFENLCSDAEVIDWTPIFNTDSIDDKIDIFNSLITNLFNTHAPIKPIKIKHSPAPWLTTEIKQLIHKKESAKSKFKARPSQHNRNSYTKARNLCNRVCRDAYRRHVHISVNKDDPAKVWQFLRSLGIGKSRLDSIPSDLDIDSLNRHFSTPGNINSTIKFATLNTLSKLPCPSHSSFTFNQFSAGDVKMAILSTTSGAIGVDGISRNMIIPILDIILPTICHILNFSIEHSVFPSLWKEAQIIPLPKTRNPQSYSEFRPISILPFLSKILERLTYKQFNSFLVKNNLLNPFQSGFRPAHSTITALIKITDDIRYGFEQGQLSTLVLLDFSNAFNTVDFDILLELLRSIKVSPAVIDWFRSYLLGRRQRVRLGDSFSSWCNTTAGVPQGGVLSPLLFATFINSISHNISSSYHLYADDLQIYSLSPFNLLNNSIQTINIDLEHILQWSLKFGLKVNPIKSQAIIVGSSRSIAKIDWNNLPAIMFDGVSIPYSREVRDLGLIIDQTLSWQPQLNNVSKKLFASVGSLRRLRNFLPTATKVMLAQSLLHPILDYADACYLDLNESQLDKLERLQNFCIRFIFGLRKYDHVSHFRHKLKWLPIRFRRNTHILTLLYSILFNPASPHYLKVCFNFLHCEHSLRSSQNLVLNMPQHSTSFFDLSFTVQAVRLWNSLPVAIRQAQTIHSFKVMVKDYYLSQNTGPD